MSISMEQAIARLGIPEFKIRLKAGELKRENKSRSLFGPRPQSELRHLQALSSARRKNVNIPMPTFSWDKDSTDR